MNIDQKNAKPLIMAILNVTPDSFSDGGLFVDKEQAVGHAKSMIAEGADIIDIGGESTRPWSIPVSPDEQIKRILDVTVEINKIKPDDVLISVDTTQSRVAEVALDAGASIINDVSAGRDDPQIIDLCAERQCHYVVMHMQGTPKKMQENPRYDDVTSEVLQFLRQRTDYCLKQGISAEHLIIDPGIGFGKTQIHNFELLSGLEHFVKLGYPVLIGASRKRFMGNLFKTPPAQLVGATVATTALGVAAGASLFRVHDVAPNRQAADLIWAINKT